jgi:protein-S-isoprenylcysteine O-methyltransferase Ste14
MAVLALILTVGWIVIVAGLRGMIQVRRTGGIGLYRGDRPGSPQWWSRRISSVGAALAVGAPLAELGGLAPIPPLDAPALRIAGLGPFLLGVAGTVIAQMAMGESWRGDVDPDARTPLVTTGPFRLVRNPILTATAVTLTGLAMMVPNVIALVMLVLSVAAMQLQVRLVEEPYLRRVHGDAYQAYATRTGRFLPGIGRLGPRSGVPLPE